MSLRKSSALRREGPRGLGPDERGETLILGLALGTILVSALSAFMALSHGIGLREAAQNAADAGAFENAVWHARGMNLLASLNLLMFASVAALALWRLAVGAVAMAGLVNAVAGISDPGAAQQHEAAAIAEPLAQMLAADEEVAARVGLIVTSLNAAQVAVSAYAPAWAAQGLATSTQSRQSSVASSASASLLPNRNESSLLEEGACLGGEAAVAARSITHTDSTSHRALHEARSSTARVQQVAASVPGVRPPSARIGVPFSLPAQRDEYSLFCRTSDEAWRSESQGVVRALSDPARSAVLEAPDADKVKARQVLGLQDPERDSLELYSKQSGFDGQTPSGALCSPVGPAVEVWKDAAWGVVARVAALEGTPPALRYRLRKLYADARTPPKGPPADLSTVHPIDTTDRARAAWQRWRSTLQSASASYACGRPVEVWAPAHNGSAYLRSTSLVASPAEEQPSADAGFWAHAEMYFDCDAGWAQCAPNALWQTRWRARLRRVRGRSELLVRDETGRVGPLALTHEAATVAWLRRALSANGGVATQSSAPMAGFLPFFQGGPLSTVLERGSSAPPKPSARDPLRGFIAEHAARDRIIH